MFREESQKMEQIAPLLQSQPNEFLQPQGFLSVVKNVGIMDETLDLTVIYSTVRARAAAMFTCSRFPGALVTVGDMFPANDHRRSREAVMSKYGRCLRAYGRVDDGQIKRF